MSHSFWPMRIFRPTSTAKALDAPRPTMISLRPDWKVRPSMILKPLRTAIPAWPTPRKGTFASVRVERFGRLMMTKSSAEASGPSALRARPGASAIRRVSSRERPLVISVLALLRRTMATSSEPDGVMAARKPSAMERTPTKTATTPAIPTAAARAAPLRSGMERRLKAVMERIWKR